MSEYLFLGLTTDDVDRTRKSLADYDKERARRWEEVGKIMAKYMEEALNGECQKID